MNGISGGELIIAEIGGTSVSKMKRFPKPYRVECRHSDAFVTVLRGECHYEFDNGVSFTVTEGDVLYLSKGSGYFMNVTVDAYDVIFTDFRFAADVQRPSERFPSVSGDPAGIMRSLYSLPSDTPVAVRLSLLYSLYGTVCATREEQPSGISKIKDEIDLYLSDPTLSVSALAEKMGVSEVYFRRLFAQTTGKPPSKYIRDVRVAHAKELLRCSSLTVSECATECGFSSLQYFCRTFKDVTDMTPSEYRRKKFRGT